MLSSARRSARSMSGRRHGRIGRCAASLSDGPGGHVVTATQAHTELRTDVAGLAIRVLEGGAGRPLVMLHHSTGNVGWAPVHAQLAESFRVLAVDMPGFGQSDRPDWAREPRDLAILLNRLLDKLELAEITLVGAGFGGWVAAEMATMTECRLSRLVLIGAAGLQPREGY